VAHRRRQPQNTELCSVLHLIAQETREGDVYLRLLEERALVLRPSLIEPDPG
jgi:hypothetical protein